MLEKFLEVLTRIAVALENGASASTGSATSTEKAADTKTTTTRGGAKGGSKTTTAAKTAPTEDETSAALSALKDFVDEQGEKGVTYARKVMNNVAGVQKMAEIPEDKRAAVIKAAEAELAAYKEALSENDEM